MRGDCTYTGAVMVTKEEQLGEVHTEQHQTSSTTSPVSCVQRTSGTALTRSPTASPGTSSRSLARPRTRDMMEIIHEAGAASSAARAPPRHPHMTFSCGCLCCRVRDDVGLPVPHTGRRPMIPNSPTHVSKADPAYTGCLCQLTLPVSTALGWHWSLRFPDIDSVLQFGHVVYLLLESFMPACSNALLGSQIAARTRG